MNRYRVLLFARYAELLGAEQIEVVLPDGASVADLTTALRVLPGGGLLPPQPLVAVNLRQAPPGTPLQPTDQIAVLPPLAGG